MNSLTNMMITLKNQNTNINNKLMRIPTHNLSNIMNKRVKVQDINNSKNKAIGLNKKDNMLNFMEKNMEGK